MTSATNTDGDCYCHLWESDPRHLIETGVPTPGTGPLLSVGARSNPLQNLEIRL